VELDKCSDEPAGKTKDGKMKWKFDLKPKEIKEVAFTFSVYMPKDRSAVFGNASIDTGIGNDKNRKAGMQQRSKK